jgi:hypothetical protein
MNRPRLDEGRRSLGVIRRVVAAVAVGAVGRALWYAAVDALVIYVFGNPAPPRRERLASVGTSPDRLRSDRPSERLVA